MTQAKCKVRPVGRLRAGKYRKTGDQLDALWKILDVILPHMPKEALDRIPTDALAELEHWSEVKRQLPKKPAKKAKSAG